MPKGGEVKDSFGRATLWLASRAHCSGSLDVLAHAYRSHQTRPQLDAPSAIHNLRRAAPLLTVQQQRRVMRANLREYFSGFLSIIGGEKNDRRDYRHHFDRFCDRTFAGESADFYWPGLDQWLLATSARSRPVALGGSSVPASCCRYSHLGDHSIGNRKPPSPAEAVQGQAIREGDVRFTPHGHERLDRARVYRLSPRTFHFSKNRSAFCVA